MHMPLSGCSVWWWLASVALVQRRGLLFFRLISSPYLGIIEAAEVRQLGLPLGLGDLAIDEFAGRLFVTPLLCIL